MRLRTAVTLIVAGLGACTTFGSETESKDGGVASDGGAVETGADAATCAVLPCSKGREGLCTSFDFADPGCPGMEIDGNAPASAARCDGALRFLVTNTDDKSVMTRMTPRLKSRSHVSFVASINDWIGLANSAERRLVDLASNGTLVTVRASTRTEKVVLELCEVTNTNCKTLAPKLERNQRFVVELVVDPNGATRMLVDCVEVGTAKALTGAVVDADFKVTFGATDGQPLDGTIDDLTIWFEPLQ